MNIQSRDLNPQYKMLLPITRKLRKGARQNQRLLKKIIGRDYVDSYNVNTIRGRDVESC